MPLSIAEQLMYSTLRIEAFDAIGSLMSTGTGFIMDFEEVDKETKSRPFVITNKHVIAGASSFRITFCSSENGAPVDTSHYPVLFDTAKFQWCLHPEEDVDLCALSLSAIVNLARQAGHELFYRTIPIELIPTIEDIETLDAIERIYIIGYPNGLWDQVNNKPIQRTGITATQISKDYEGKKEFLIDCSVYPGSSGSPVILFDNGSFTPKEGSLNIGTRILLLGVVYAVYQHNAQGVLHPVQIPTGTGNMISTQIPSNIGIVIKAEKIRQFKELFGI
jgi:hypothetical protein